LETAVLRPLREKGVLIGVGGGLANVLRIQSPLSISKEELTQAVDALKDILENESPPIKTKRITPPCSLRLKTDRALMLAAGNGLKDLDLSAIFKLRFFV